ncbi:hypothetical protein [Curtobacterium sp. RRHDQ10]|uniref:hypothetical protein n=1 Tax=Curtobacterium phyllosphaerae TaxID=3413379 RepID=UPI003BEF9AD5
MAGELRLDGDGLAGLVRELTTRGAAATDHASDADAALDAAAGAVVSAPLAAAVGALADRFRGQAAPVGSRMTGLGTALTTTASVFAATDGRLADRARGTAQ